MSNFRCDTHVPDHIKSAVTASQTLTGDYIEMTGCVGASVMASCTNGAAGAIYVDGSNQLGTNSIWVQCATATVAANGTAVLTFSGTDQITPMHKLRCRFVSSSAGNVQVSVNGRRVTY